MPREERERELKKKKWARPKLIVLVRGDRQEGVLVACKGSGDFFAGDQYNQFASNCLQWGGETACMADCNLRAVS